MKNIALGIIFFFFIQNAIMTQTKPKLIYFGDPMCSWCYGFSPEFSEAMESLGDSFDYQFVMGGLRPYNQEQISSMEDFLKEHWHHVSEASGQPFSYEILKTPDYVYDTEPPCRAVVTMRKLKPEVEFDYFKAIQSAFYFENQNTNLTQTYVNLAVKFGLDAETFRKELESEEMKNAVKEDFSYSSNIGVRGFPTVVLQNGDKYYMISNGYMKAEQVVQRCRNYLNSEN